MKIRPVAAELLQAGGRTDRQIDTTTRFRATPAVCAACRNTRVSRHKN
jgi:hypothetical protein